MNGCWHWLWQKLSCAGVGDGDLDHAVGQLPRHHLVEPDAVEARVLHADGCEDLLPDGRVEQRRLLRAAARARRPSRGRGRVGREHGDVSSVDGQTAYGSRSHDSRRQRLDATRDDINVHRENAAERAQR